MMNCGDRMTCEGCPGEFSGRCKYCPEHLAELQVHFPGLVEKRMKNKLLDLACGRRSDMQTEDQGSTPCKSIEDTGADLKTCSLLQYNPNCPYPRSYDKVQVSRCLPGRSPAPLYSHSDISLDMRLPCKSVIQSPSTRVPFSCTAPSLIQRRDK